MQLRFCGWGYVQWSTSGYSFYHSFDSFLSCRYWIKILSAEKRGPWQNLDTNKMIFEMINIWDEK